MRYQYEDRPRDKGVEQDIVRPVGPEQDHQRSIKKELKKQKHVTIHLPRLQSLLRRLGCRHCAARCGQLDIERPGRCGATYCHPPQSTGHRLAPGDEQGPCLGLL